MWAVMGLGNPGRSYARTRHNVGFIFVQQLAERWGTRIRKRRHSSRVAGVTRPQGSVLLVMPQTYMNSSGLAARTLVRESGIRPDRLIVIYDDFDLPLGEIRIRKDGSAGSHKGMGSIIAELATSRIARIRIGIGPLPSEADPVDFVLSPLSSEEREKLAVPLGRAMDALDMILSGQIDAAMNRFN